MKNGMKYQKLKLSILGALLAGTTTCPLGGVYGAEITTDITSNLTLTEDTTVKAPAVLTVESGNNQVARVSIKGNHTLTFDGNLQANPNGSVDSYINVYNAYNGQPASLDIEGNVRIQGNDNASDKDKSMFSSAIRMAANYYSADVPESAGNELHIHGTTDIKNLNTGTTYYGDALCFSGYDKPLATAQFDGNVNVSDSSLYSGLDTSYGHLNFKNDLIFNNVDTDNYLLDSANSQISARNISFDNVRADWAGALIQNSTIQVENVFKIKDLDLTNEQKMGNLATLGVYADGSTIEAPDIVLDHMNADSAPGTVHGLTFKAAYGGSASVVKADSIYVGNVTAGASDVTTGLNLMGTQFGSFHKDATNNVTVENITSKNENNITLGIQFAFTKENILDQPYDITGNTIIRGITSEKGIAAGFWQNGGAMTSQAKVNLHNLEISDIHGKNGSIGILGATGDTIADNAIVNVTGQNQYAGLYGSNVPDNEKKVVNQVAIYGYSGRNVLFDKPDGMYKIYGDVVSLSPLSYYKEKPDMLNEWLSSLKNGYMQQGFTEEQADAITADIRQNVLNGGKIGLGGHLSLYGDLYAKNRGIIDINLTKGSIFEGQADAYTDIETAGSLLSRNVDTDEIMYRLIYGAKYDEYKEAMKEAELEQELYEGIPSVLPGTINVNMENGSLWKTHGRNFVTNLNFKDGGLVDMHDGNGGSLSVEKLSGNGTFQMDLSNDAQYSDMLYAKDISEAGTQTIQVNLQKGIRPDDLKGVRFATTGGNDVGHNDKFKLNLYKNQGVNNVTLKVQTETFDPSATAANERFNGGKNGQSTYKPGNEYVTAIYSGQPLTKKVPDENKIYEAINQGKEIEDLYDNDGKLLPDFTRDVPVENSTKDGTNWFIDSVERTPSDSGKIIKKAAQLDYANAVSGIYTDNLNKRLGEARYSRDGDGLWARIRHDQLGREALYTAKNTMTEIGYDWKRDEDSFGKHIQGAALDYMDGSADYKEIKGDSDTKRYGIWFYDTRLGNKGHYTDFIAKYGRLFNKYNLYEDTGDTVHADYHNDYYSLSLEYGRKKALASSWFIEPQAQLQYTYLGSTDYRNSQGSKVQLAGTDSLISRIGFRLGRDIGNKTSFYLTADYLHEFLGNQDLTAMDITGAMDVTGHNDGSWYNAGFGFTTALNKNTYAFANYEHSYGNHLEHTWSAEAGINWKF